MLVVAKVDIMTPPAAATLEKSTAGRAIAARRAFLNKSRADIQEDTNGVIYEKLLARIETGVKSVRSLRLTQFNALTAALGWSPTEFRDATGVELPAAEPVPGSRPFNGTIQVPVYGSVSAGVRGTEANEEPLETIALDPALPGVRGRAVSSLGILTVNGDSMVSPKAHESIPQGSMVLVEWGAAPQPDDFVVAWVDVPEAPGGTAVLKKLREGPGVALVSLNPLGPVFRVGEEGVDVRGVVRLILRKP